MNDVQLLTITLTLLAILGATFSNRKSVEDMRDVLGAELKGEMLTLRLEMNTAFARIENKLDHIVGTQASHSERLDKLEGGRS